MKHIFFAAMLLFMTISSFAQNPLTKGRNQINAGIGLSNWGIPVYFGFDHGIGQDISFGLEVSFRSFNENFKSNKYKHSIIGFSGNGNYHFNRVLNIPSNYDFYAGLNLGFYSWSSPNDYNGSNNSGVGLGGQVGGRYFFSSKTAINLEFGGSNAFSGGKIGLTFKI